MGQNLRDASRVQWASRTEPPTEDELKLGALLRIADATEKMAQQYNDLIVERDRYKRFYNNELTRRERMDRQIAALRGVITKMRKAQEK